MARRLDEFAILRKQCIAGVKAFQNLHASKLGFEKLLSLADSTDQLILASVFQTAVVRYAKPFVESRMPSEKFVFATKRIKRKHGFNPKVHAHLLHLRNTLVAHDDFLSIEPRLLFLSLAVVSTEPDGEPFDVPTKVAVSNKCLSFPADSSTVQLMLAQASAAAQGVYDYLAEDISKIRDVKLKRPDLAKASTRHHEILGRQDILPGGTKLNMPDVSDHAWLNMDVPDFSDVHTGFRYETLQIVLGFAGPETIKLPDGRTVVLTP